MMKRAHKSSKDVNALTLSIVYDARGTKDINTILLAYEFEQLASMDHGSRASSFISPRSVPRLGGKCTIKHELGPY